MRGLDVRSGVKWGLAGGAAIVFTAAVGLVEAFDQTRMIISPILSMGFLALLWLVPILGYGATVMEELEGVDTAEKGPGNILTGTIVGVTGGAALSLFTFVLQTWDIRDIFVKFSPTLLRILTFHREDAFWGGLAMMFVLVVVLGTAGGAIHYLDDRRRRQIMTAAGSVVVVSLFERVFSQILRQIQLEELFKTVLDRSLITTVYNDGGLTWGAALLVGAAGFWLSGRKRDGKRVEIAMAKLRSPDATERIRWSLIYAAFVVVTIILAPILLGSLLSELLANVGLFMLMGLGLNIVVGLAGMLDLGYVAFFAVGAYTVGVLTSPQFSFGWSWWAALPVAIALSALAGLLVGAPVIKMRGDYLAIVTLGFGEIVRILFLSDWLKPFFGGAQGIPRVPPIDVGVAQVSGIRPQGVLYFVAAFVILAAWVSYAVQQSRVGRAWTAIREDESVAEVMGIDTVKAKLQAFVVGAILAGLGGALFAAKLGSIFPTSFKLLVSIIILVVVIVGGMGSIRGVMVGALVLIGVLGGPTQPGLLLEFAEFKLLIVGVVLIYMMLQRPEGLVPRVRRTMELHHEELSQDAWLDKAGEFTEGDDAEHGTQT